jgi:predicted phage terminase large subunit-like protein
MSSYDPKLLQALLRQKLAAFIEKSFATVSPGDTYRPNWHIDAIAHHLTEVAQGNITRLIINIPPRHLKSIATSVALPAWILGHDPSRKIVCASYGQDLARKHSLDTRAVMKSKWYRETFPSTTLSDEQLTQDFYTTTAKGSRLATSLGGTLMGLGGNLIIIDDPMKAADAASETERKSVKDWYDQAVLSRLNDKSTDAIILVMQRLHEDDLAGHLLAQGNWTHLNIPAVSPYDIDYRTGSGEADVHRFEAGSVIDPQRESNATLAESRRSMGNRAYAAQYLQSPVPESGNLLDWSWFKFYDPTEVGPMQYVLQSWDVASSEHDGDYSVCTTWGIAGTDTMNFYLINLYRDRCGFPDLIRRARSLFEKHKADAMVVEAVGSGVPFYQQLSSILLMRVYRDVPRESKVVRADQISMTLEQGRVFLPRTASWLEGFRNEVLAFPKGKHDDQVDSMVQFLRLAKCLTAKVRNLGLSRSRDRSPTTSNEPVTPSAPRRPRHDLRDIDRVARDHFGRW